MIAETGHFALVLALALALVQAIAGFWAGRSGDAGLQAMTRAAAVGACAFIASSFASLTWAYVASDFSVRNVIENSHSAKPLIYKITGVWGNHEGSMLLWALALSIFAAMVAAGGRDLPDRLRSNALGAQGLIASLFLLFILATSNPFWRVDPPPLEGNDLNPVLQDLGLAIYPPLLYLGYVGFSIAFCFAIAALIDGRIDAAWAKHVRPWTLAAWIFLTLGIAMGSYWAYYELGWGGFWFWDPVENASLMPWLAGTALLHSTIVMEKREALKVWTILLAILTFSLSLIGTFLVRSGVLTSVHSFAADPTRGVFILAILIICIGGSLALFAWHAPQLKQGGLFAPISREGALVFNNLFLASACAAVFVGTLYPLALEAIAGVRISVGAPFFNMTVLPLMAPLVLAMPLGQTLAWKRGDLAGGFQRLFAALGAAILVTLVVAAFTWRGPWLAPLALGAGVWLILGAFAEVATRAFARGKPLATSLARLAGLPRSAFGTALAHSGVGVTVIGLAATAWSGERIAVMRPGESVEIGGYALRLDSVAPRRGPNYREDVATFAVTLGGVEMGAVESARRVYPSRNMPTTEAGLWTRGASQLYVSLAEPEPDGGTSVRAYYKPLVLLIWIGAVRMAAGGALSLSDRRRRIGAPTPAREALAAAGGMTVQAVLRMFPAIVIQRSRNRRALSLLGAACALWLSFSAPAFAVQPDEILKDPALEARARRLSGELRCLVCQNQSIDDSDAPLARDLRILVRERLTAGDTDDAVKTFLVARYGEFVLLRPALNARTVALWSAPFVVLIVGILAAAAARRRSLADAASAPLTDEEKERLARLAGGD